MKNLILLIIGLSTSFLSFSQNGTAFETTSFESIQISNAFTVHLTQSDQYSVTVEAPQDLMDKIHIEVEDDVLEIRMKEKTKWNWKKGQNDIVVHISFPSIEELSISGAVELDGTNLLKLEDFTLEASGASEIDLKVSCDDLDIDLSGASEMTMDIYATNASLETSGASEIVFTGSADGLDIECSGASDIQAGEFKAGEVSIECSGASSIRVWADHDVSVDASGASAIYYHCENCDDVEVSTTGNSSVKKY